MAWERAVEKAGGRKVTARIVQSAVKELQLRGAETPVNQLPHPSKVAQRAIIDGAIDELLTLLSQKPPSDNEAALGTAFEVPERARQQSKRQG